MSQLAAHINANIISKSKLKDKLTFEFTAADLDPEQRDRGQLAFVANAPNNASKQEGTDMHTDKVGQNSWPVNF
jgi:hypothetical protein